MIIQTKLFQESCKKILDAVDNNTDSVINETLELEANGNILFLNVTNKEYFVSVKMPLDTDAEIHAVVNAHLFLKLVSKITTGTLELSVVDNALVVKANGNYKIPMIFNGETMVTIPKIEINNVTNNFQIKNSILQSILKHNTREVAKGNGVSPVQKLFYIDEQGALTFTNGACANLFTLEQKVVITLTEKIVRLFKLFKSENIDFTMGFDEVEGDEVAQKVSFKDNQVTITTIISTKEELIRKFPVKSIRDYLKGPYKYTITVDRTLLLDAINRLSLFSKNGSDLGFIYMLFGVHGVSLFDRRKENVEEVTYVDSCEDLSSEQYKSAFNANNLKLILEASEGDYATISFGNRKSIVIRRNDIYNILPEAQAV